MAKETKEAAESKAPASSLEEQLGKIADIMLARSSGQIKGGTPHVPLSAEEVAKLPKKTMQDVASEYLQGKDSTNFPYPGIHVTSDLMIFIGNVQGENAMSNHKAVNPGMTHISVPTPGLTKE